MGRALVKTVRESDHGFEIVGGVDPFCTHDLPFPVFTSAAEIDVPVDVVIDFSVPKATEEILAFSLERKIPAVICTTALSDGLIAEIDAASKEIPVFRSGNMSLGVNLMRVLLKQASNMSTLAGPRFPPLRARLGERAAGSGRASAGARCDAGPGAARLSARLRRDGPGRAAPGSRGSSPGCGAGRRRGRGARPCSHLLCAERGMLGPIHQRAMSA